MADLTVRRTIEKRHGDALHQFRRVLLDDENLFSVARPYEDGRTPGLGPLRSVTDRHADITFGGDRAELAYAVGDSTLEGYKLTLSMAGHHRLMGSRVPLSTEETDAWLYAILGTDWADHSYHIGALSGVEGRLTTVFYWLYLSENQEPIPCPVKDAEQPMAPVRAEAWL
jgi:hypothetical protein